MLINWFSALSVARIVQLIRRIPDDHVKLHLPNLLWLDCVDELIGMLLQVFRPVILRFAGPAESATAPHPIMGKVLETDIPLRLVKRNNGIATIGELATVQAATGEHGSHLRDGDTIELPGEDVLPAFFFVRDDILQSLKQALGNLPEEHTGLAGGIYVPADFDTK